MPTLLHQRLPTLGDLQGAQSILGWSDDRLALAMAVTPEHLHAWTAANDDRPLRQQPTKQWTQSVIALAANQLLALNKVTNYEFVTAMFNKLPAGAAPVVCGFPGDPNNQPAYAWSVDPVLVGDFPAALCDDSLNTYCGVSSFYKAKDGRYRRRKSCFAALHYLMLDDLGTGQGAKVSMDMLALKPTALIETSPDNYQAMLRLKDPVTDFDMADRLIRAMISQGLLSEKDPGMAGVTRVGRLPNGINGKPKYGGWCVRLAEWNPDIEYTPDEICEAFGLDLNRVASTSRYDAYRSLLGADKLETLTRLAKEEDPIYAALVAEGHIAADAQLDNKGGDGIWVDMRCPWIGNHSERADTGAGYQIGGRFKCHHGGCADRRIEDVLNELGLSKLLQELHIMRAKRAFSITEAVGTTLIENNPYLTGKKHNG